MPLDDEHLVAAVRTIALNPVRARLVGQAEDWEWSSARAHLAGRDDALARVALLLDRVGRISELVAADTDRVAFAALRAAEATGRPLGSHEFVAMLERRVDRRLRKRKPGRKPHARAEQMELGLMEGRVSGKG